MSCARLTLVVTILLASIVSPASAQSCETALALIARGDLGGAERELAMALPEEVTACALHAWARIAEARGEAVRASALDLRAFRAEAGEGVITPDEIAAHERALPEPARRVAEAELAHGLDDLDAVPTLAMLREITRASIETNGWYSPGSVACRVEGRARHHGIEVAVLRVIAERITQDDELRLAVRDDEGWRVVARIEPEVQNGHGWRGAIELVDLDVRPTTITVQTRSWVLDVDSGGSETRPIWRAARVVCDRTGDTVRCAP